MRLKCGQQRIYDDRSANDRKAIEGSLDLLAHWISRLWYLLGCPGLLEDYRTPTITRPCSFNASRFSLLLTIEPAINYIQRTPLL